MSLVSSLLAELLEPTLFALRTPSETALAPLVEKARRAMAHATTALGRDLGAVHSPSYELGVAATFVELLGTAEQRTEIEDALAELRRRSWGTSLLHEIALIEQNAEPVKQRELAEKLAMDSGNLSRRIQELMSLHLVKRQSAGRLGTLFALTPLGRDLLDALVPGWQALDPRSQSIYESDEAAARASTALIDQHMGEIVEERMRLFPAAIKDVMQALTADLRLMHSDHKIQFGGGYTRLAEGRWLAPDQVQIGSRRTGVPIRVFQAA
jgi:DNA-binding MarR family transcriptional regulator